MITDPLAEYSGIFKERFARHAENAFEQLAERSRVDIHANKLTVSAIRKLQAHKRKVDHSRFLWSCVNAVLWLLVLGGGVFLFWAWSVREDGILTQEKMLLYCICAASGIAVSLLLYFCWSRPKSRLLEEKSAELARKIDAETQTAWLQMEPLNRLFTWDIIAGLIEKTIPSIAFDRCFTREKEQRWAKHFNWNSDINSERSVVNCHSGTVSGNPFILAEFRKMNWCMKTYTGQIVITWREYVSDSSGKRRLVSRSQVLTASVQKPVPVYENEKMLFFGNHAAPELCFSREPSELSGGKGGFGNAVKRYFRMRSLRKYARNLDDDSNFTMMSNEEFELLFHARNRDNEVEFRLLFTPLAQKLMVDMLNDRKTGFGDNFHFIKEHSVNTIIADHLNMISFDQDPRRFAGFEFAAIKDYFLQYANGFFKAFYFALAPLMIIPLYQQPAPEEADDPEAPESEEPSFWEHEMLVNFCGDDQFEHPACITQNILKTQVLEQHDGGSLLQVSAHGFRGETRVEVVPVFGGDGKMHMVPVEWIEYLPVVQENKVFVRRSSPQEETLPENTVRCRELLLFR